MIYLVEHEYSEGNSVSSLFAKVARLVVREYAKKTKDTDGEEEREER